MAAGIAKCRRNRSSRHHRPRHHRMADRARRVVTSVCSSTSATPETRKAPARAILARFAQWWVVMERSEDLIRIGGAGTASVEGAANAVLAAQIERLCGKKHAGLATAGHAGRRCSARRCEQARRPCESFCTSSDWMPTSSACCCWLRIRSRSAQSSIVALQSGVETGQPTRTHVEQSAVTIIDTPEGRLVAEHVLSAGKKWMVIAPGTGHQHRCCGQPDGAASAR